MKMLCIKKKPNGQMIQVDISSVFIDSSSIGFHCNIEMFTLKFEGSSIKFKMSFSQKNNNMLYYFFQFFSKIAHLEIRLWWSDIFVKQYITKM